MKQGRDLLLFLEAAKTGSFSEAARRQHVTPSAVSKAVARLENATHARLFDRNSYQLAITPEGRAFAESVQEAFALIDDAFNQLDNGGGQAAGHVRVSTIASFGRHFIAPLLTEFQAAYPQISIEIVFDDGLPDLIGDGFDLAVRRGPIAERETVVRHICTLPLALVASAEYLARRGAPAAPADLAQHECIGIQFASRRRATWIFVAPDGEVSSIAPRGRLVLSEQPVDVLIDMVAAGAGVAAIARPFVVDRIASGEFVVVLPQFRMERPVEMYVQMPGRRHVPPRVRAFVDFLVSRLRADPRLALEPAILQHGDVA